MQKNWLFLLLTLCLLTSIPLVSAFETVTDSFDNTSKIASSTQIDISGGNAQLDTYPVSIGLAGFSSCRKLTIDAGDINADLTNFPILVHLNSSTIDWSKVQDDLDDLRFTQDNSTLLMAELDSYTVNSIAWIWVKIPAIDDTVNTELFMYYNNATCGSYWNPESVWDANYVMVQHLNDATTSTTLDSTSNNNDGTKTSANNPIVTTSGKIGSAQNFDGSNDRIQITDNNGLDVTKITLEAYVYCDTSSAVNNYGMVVSKGVWDADGSDAFEFGNYYLTGIWRLNITNTSRSGGFAIPRQVWSYVTLTYDGITVTTYVNGVFSSSATWSGTIGINALNLFIGCPAGYKTGRFWGGLIDEVRMSNSSRSSAWILASYETQRLHLINYSAEENAGNAYYEDGYFQSVNLLSGLNVTEITSLTYNCTLSGTEQITLQFSQNLVSWFNTTTVNGYHTLNNGTDTINLKVLGWVGGFFYYRCNMSDTTTPQLHSLSLNYSTMKPSSYTSFVFILVIVALVIGILALGSRNRD